MVSLVPVDSPIHPLLDIVEKKARKMLKVDEKSENIRGVCAIEKKFDLQDLEEIESGDEDVK